ncbi:MAG: hypothetical protein ABFD98_08785, partial [Syntrophobacteraceae bacterium]
DTSLLFSYFPNNIRLSPSKKLTRCVLGMPVGFPHTGEVGIQLASFTMLFIAALASIVEASIPRALAESSPFARTIL